MWPKLLLRCFLFAALTVITQVGGLVLLATWSIAPRINIRWSTRYPKLLSSALFFALYLITSAFVVPPLARLNGRTPLPVFSKGPMRPRTVWTALLNRNYVDIELDQLLAEVATEFAASHTGARVLYMDACFPFFEGFSLLPHLSHDDGRKVDLAFIYHAIGGTTPVDQTPSPIGYGAFEQPFPGEEDTAARCAEQGAWWYTMLGFVPRDEQLVIHEQATSELVQALADHRMTGKIFIEPFLKTRWHISSDKVRFHGCQAVSHADHIHVQL